MPNGIDRGVGRGTGTFCVICPKTKKNNSFRKVCPATNITTIPPPPRLSYSPGRISTQGDLALGVLVLAAALAQPQFFILHQGEANAIVAGAGALGALVPSSVPSYLAQNEVKPKQE